MNMDDEAERLEQSINEQIAVECETRSMSEWDAVAQSIANKTHGIESWDYRWTTPIGAFPQISLTRHRGFTGSGDYSINDEINRPLSTFR
ncbi:MAG: hypothetical protein AAGJ83_14990 [Planctomycetota bacterium]